MQILLLCACIVAAVLSTETVLKIADPGIDITGIETKHDELKDVVDWDGGFELSLLDWNHYEMAGERAKKFEAVCLRQADENDDECITFNFDGKDCQMNVDYDCMLVRKGQSECHALQAKSTRCFESVVFDLETRKCIGSPCVSSSDQHEQCALWCRFKKFAATFA